MSDAKTPPAAAASTEAASYLDMPDERRALAKAHAALLAATAARIALTLPFSAGVDDFRRVLTQEAKP
jgi:hypothetical protein